MYQKIVRMNKSLANVFKRHSLGGLEAYPTQRGNVVNSCILKIEFSPTLRWNIALRWYLSSWKLGHTYALLKLIMVKRRFVTCFRRRTSWYKAALLLKFRICSGFAEKRGPCRKIGAEKEWVIAVLFKFKCFCFVYICCNVAAWLNPLLPSSCPKPSGCCRCGFDMEINCLSWPGF